jgi:hypothetical protein
MIGLRGATKKTNNSPPSTTPPIVLRTFCIGGGKKPAPLSVMDSDRVERG